MVDSTRSRLFGGRRVRPEVSGHTRRVQRMKILLPVVALALVATIFAVGRDQDERSSLLSPQEIAALGAGLTLNNPRFAGHTEDGLPYVIRAETAEPEGAVPDRIQLTRPDGELTLANGVQVTGRAAAGMLLRKADKLLFFGGATFETSEGYRFETRRVMLDFGARTVTSRHRVRGEGPAGSIEAARMEIELGPEDRRDRRIFFHDDVRVIFIPKTSRADGPDRAGGG